MLPINTSRLKHDNKPGVQMGFMLGLVIISLSPFVFASMALALVNPSLGVGIFNHLLNYLLGSMLSLLSALIVSSLLIKKLSPADSLSEFIARHAKKIFFIGVILYYLMVAWSLVKNPSYTVIILLGVAFSSFAFIVMFLMLIFIRKLLRMVESSK